MEAEALRAIVAENRQLEQNLTKRNEQYIFDLKKSLKAANLAAMSLFSKGTAQPLGLTTYILGAMAGGYVFYLMHKYVYRFDRQGGDKSKRPGWLKTTAILFGGMFLWIAVFAGSAMLPPVINPILDPMIALVIGALAFVARYFFKKKYNIQGSFMTRQ